VRRDRRGPGPGAGAGRGVRYSGYVTGHGTGPTWQLENSQGSVTVTVGSDSSPLQLRRASFPCRRWASESAANRRCSSLSQCHGERRPRQPSDSARPRASSSTAAAWAGQAAFSVLGCRCVVAIPTQCPTCPAVTIAGTRTHDAPAPGGLPGTEVMSVMLSTVAPGTGNCPARLLPAPPPTPSRAPRSRAEPGPTRSLSGLTDSESEQNHACSRRGGRGRRPARYCHGPSPGEHDLANLKLIMMLDST
jgi:hypothetical protein